MRSIAMLVSRMTLALPLLCVAQAQPPVTPAGTVIIAGSSYRMPGPAQEAAPGQLMLITVYGIKTSIPESELATVTAGGWPHSIHGVSVDLVQGDPTTITPVELRAIQQGFCAVPAACSSSTGITLQIPFTLQPDTARFPYLRISENGTAVGAVMLRTVSDKIHVVNTCDSTQIKVGAASSAPPDVCTPAVLVNGSLNSLYNLVRSGDQLAMWTYGLGELKQPPVAESRDQLPKPIANVQLNFDYRPNAPASPAVGGYGLTAEPLFVGYAGAGLYQVNFTVPPGPHGVPACDGVKIKSNLTVTISGPNSHDAAQLCVEPQ
jgi:uncharacterized protein (TIGR03437 family)